jgi:hypothetical protein
MFQGTALQIIQQAASELGLPVPSSGLTSREATALQLIALLNRAGYELSLAYEWQVLNRLATITTVAGQFLYDLPSDTGRIINQTIWSSDSLQPVDGPVSSQRWEAQTKGVTNSGPFIGFRIIGNQIQLNPAPAASGQTITFEYISNGWIQSYLDPAQYLTVVQNDQDTVLFDMFLMVALLKVKMWSAKGLDTTALETDLKLLFNMLTSADKGAAVMSLTPRRRRFLSSLNVPEVGYGL